MKNYEMMFIVKTTLEETAVKNTVKEFSDIITSMNGKITNTKEMGQRELAYPINKEVNGFYYVFNLLVAFVMKRIENKMNYYS